MKIEHTKIQVMSKQLEKVARLYLQIENSEKELSILREQYETEKGILKTFAQEL